MRNVMIAMGVFVSGCALDDVEDGDELDVGTTEQEVSGWLEGGYTSTTSLSGWDTGKSTSSWTCVLSQVAGDLGEGGQFQAADVKSTAAIRANAAGRWEVYAHGGAYADQTNSRVWANNVVTASTVCVPYPKVSIPQSIYISSHAPQRLASAPANRYCFLQGIAGGGQVFTHSDDFVRVKKYTTTDASHPTTGWYVEGNLTTQATNGITASATAVCIDFPTGTVAYGNTLEVPGTHAVTSGSGIKMCGLQSVVGAFNVNTWNHGVVIDPPLGLPDGQWTITVSSGKRGRALCVK